MSNLKRDGAMVISLVAIWVAAISLGTRSQTDDRQEWFVRRDTNVRDGFVIKESKVLGKAERGESYIGKVVRNWGNGGERWLEVASPTRYLWLANLSQTPPPDCVPTKLKSVTLSPSQTTAEPNGTAIGDVSTDPSPRKFNVICRIGPAGKDALLELATSADGGVVYGRRDGSSVASQASVDAASGAAIDAASAAANVVDAAAGAASNAVDAAAGITGQN